ncbi:hypothetical protein [Nocardia salmonicida]|uniref:hypothetical protein n=1 Tax=Nocardia salmonicida TaxID=53431 RepID=UPI002E2A4667|nr:hypothetical protein [Nocardia salmonicida]
MPENTTEPILPIPSDLDQQTWQAREALQNVRRQICELEKSYRALHGSPDSLRTDDLGQPTTPTETTSAALMWLASTGRALSAADDGMRRAGSHTTRLSLTEEACDERERRIDERKAAFNRRRGIERTR